MGMMADLREVFRVLGEFPHLLSAMTFKMPAADEPGSLGSMFEDTVARYPDNTMLLFEGRQWTYAEFNAQVNQLAHLLKARGIKRGDCVAVLMENRVPRLRWNAMSIFSIQI